MSQNGQSHFKNLAAFAAKDVLFKYCQISPNALLGNKMDQSSAVSFEC